MAPRSSEVVAASVIMPDVAQQSIRGCIMPTARSQPALSHACMSKHRQHPQLRHSSRPVSLQLASCVGRGRLWPPPDCGASSPQARCRRRTRIQLHTPRRPTAWPRSHPSTPPAPLPPGRGARLAPVASAARAAAQLRRTRPHPRCAWRPLQASWQLLQPHSPHRGRAPGGGARAPRSVAARRPSRPRPRRRWGRCWELAVQTGGVERGE
mgnify:CR=1 FL=1